MSPAARTHRSDAALLARGAIVNLLGNIGRLSRAFSLMLIAWLFGAEALGLYVLAWATTEFLRRFVSYGIEPTIVYKLGPLLVSHDDTRISQTIASSLVLVGVTSLVGSLALYFGAPFIANTVLREPRLVEVLPVFVFAMPAFAVTSVFLAATRAKKIMRFEIIARSFVEPFVLLLGTLVAWAAKTGVTGLVVAQTSAFWISAFFCAYFYGTQFPLRALFAALRRPSHLAGVFHFATPVAAKDVIAQGVARIDLFLVGHLLDAKAVGVYGIVLELVVFSKHARQALEPIMAPLVAEQHHTADRERLHRTYANATRWALLVNLGLFGVAQIAGDSVLSIYGKDFKAGGTALAILFFGQIVSGTFGLSETVLLMVGRPALMLGDMALLLAMIGVFDYAAIQVWGLTGAALGTAGATMLVVLLQVRQARKKAGVHPWSRALLKPVGACALGLAVAHLLPLGELDGITSDVVKTATFSAIYSLLLVWLGMEAEEKHLGAWVKAKLHSLLNEG